VDSLTELPNREVFLDMALRAIDRAASSQSVAGVVVVELDDFKMVNNTMGHSGGDELLIMMGRRLTSLVRAEREGAAAGNGGRRPGTEWVVARLGGDEFAVCVGDARDENEVVELVERIMASFAEPYQLSQGAVTAAATLGVASTLGAGTGADAQELLRQADLAVYAAKDAGKGRWIRYEASLHTEVLDRLRLRTDLEEAVAEGAFTLEYQPIVALASGVTTGFEVLVRWNHPIRGMLPPVEFIPLAEESGLIVPLGEWVLRQATEAAARWARLRPDAAPYMSVNVSARQFRSPSFVDQVRAALAEAGLPPQSLTLEITESLLVRDGGVVQVLDTLRADGVRVAIDDFGTGFSSLSYLRKLPVDVLKLDKSFVDTLTSSQEQYAIIDAITKLAGTLHLDVVAEGIETTAQLDILVAMGCGFGQGYLLSRPMSYGSAVRWFLDAMPAPVGAGRAAR
jgi:diguanylate cyclase (GGDEF)-like protein